MVSAQMAPINDGAAMKMHTLASLQTLSYSTHQDRAPVRSIGNINAKDYVQGQRTIAGTMVFAMFHQHWMVPLLEELEDHVSNTDLWSDELPALNLTISMVNEYGYRSCMVIYGVKFIDDGGVMSINDLYTENTLQYVATGIQPLKGAGFYHHSHNTKVSPFKISEYSIPERSWSWQGIENYNKKWPSKYREVEFDATSTYIPTRYTFKPHVYINKPIVKDDNFIINIFQKDTTGDKSVGVSEDIISIYLTDTANGTLYNGIRNPVNNIWAISAPQGIYQLGAIDIYGNDMNDLQHLILDYDITSTDEDDYPVIVEVGDTNVKVLPNNSTHDYITLTKVIEGNIENNFIDEITDENYTYEIATHTYIGQSNSKEVLIENLTPDTKYNLYTFKLGTSSKSKIVSFKTFKYQDYENDLLKEYITNNANILLCENLSDYKLKSNAEYEYDNIIDSLLDLPDSDEKTELLFYAVKLQNELNALYNESGNFNNVSLDRTTPLFNRFNVDDLVSSFVIYKRNYNRNYYITKIPSTTNYEYIGKSNVRYFVQPILKDNKKSSRNDFICFTDEQKKFLSKYNGVNLISELSFIDYEYTYDKYNSNLKEAIKASNNLSLYRDILPAPYGYVQNGILVVDVDYSNYSVDEYYLCIATPMDSLDYTPIRKIKINNGDAMLQLEKYRTGIMRDNYYLLWIQDKKFNNISPAYILSTYNDDLDIQDYYQNKINNKIKDIKSQLPSTVYGSYLNDTILNILAEEDIKDKDLDYYIVQSVLAMYEEQLTPYVMDDIVINVIDVLSKNNDIKSIATFDGSHISFTFDNSNYISCITITSNSIIKNTYDDYYDIENNDDGYTILYLANKYNNSRSGYVLVNNKTKEVYSSNIRLEMVNDGR